MSCEIIYPVEFPLEILGATATDHDGVMANTKVMATETFNEWFGTNHKPQELNRWDSIKRWGLDYGLSEASAAWIEKEIFYKEDLLFKSKPMPGAVKFMGEAYSRGYKIPIYSSRPSEQRVSTLLWYEEYMPFIDPENINVGLPDVHKTMTKVWMILKGGKPIRLFIEDVQHNVKDILESTDASVVYVSNDGSLDHYLGERLFRISGKNGETPDLWPLYNAFFGNRR